MTGDPATPVAAASAGKKPHHFAFVDALRGYAILAVMLFHANQVIANSHPLLHRLAGYGGNGVQLFFVISAFTLFWSMRNRRSVDRRPLRAFFARRLFRIVPLFWVGILFYLGHPDYWRDQFAPNGIGPPQILTTILFVHGWYPTTINSVVPGGWSIAAEMMFYLTLPFLFRRVRSFNRAIAVAVGGSIVVYFAAPTAVRLLSARFPADWSGLISLFVGFSFPAQFPCFCWGIVLYFLLTDQHRPDRGRVIVIAACAALLSPGLHDFFFAAVFVLLAWLLSTRPIPLISNRLVRYLGLISYSGYLWHFWILDWLAPWLVPAIHVTSRNPYANGTVRLLVLYVGLVLVTALTASISYFLIERPFIRFGQWMINALGWGSGRGIVMTAEFGK